MGGTFNAEDAKNAETQREKELLSDGESGPVPGVALEADSGCSDFEVERELRKLSCRNIQVW